MSVRSRLEIIVLFATMLTSIPIAFASSTPPGDNVNCKDMNLADSLNRQASPNSVDLKYLNRYLKECLYEQNYKTGWNIVTEIERKIKSGTQDSSVLAESYYYIGVLHQLIYNTDLAIHYLNLAISLKESIEEYDDIYAKALYNTGAAYSRLGIFEKHLAFTKMALEAERNFYGPENHNLVSTYASLITAYIELKNYNKALELTDIAFRVADINSETGNPFHFAFLYNNIGVLYNSIGDYSRSKIFFEKAEEYYTKAGIASGENYNNLLYGMANSLKNLGLQKESEEYYEKGIKLAMKDYSLSSYMIISNYANNLGSSGKCAEGKSVMSSLLKRVESRDGKFSKSYFDVLCFFAIYLGKYDIQKDTALVLYENCIKYFDKQGDSFLKFDVKIGYSLLLSERGEYLKSLEVLQTLLYPQGFRKNGINIFMNPDIDSINADRDFLMVLKTKHQILKSYYNNQPDKQKLESITGTSELIIALLERIRINISEEESRLLLGNRYRDSYLDVINDFYHLYSITGAKTSLDKAFEYSEKSKIAGLLAATRELRATEFHIPPDLAEAERELQTEIALLNDRISGKTVIENRTEDLIKRWKSSLFNTMRMRDSLVKVFERDYPEYYSIKYNTSVLRPGDIPEIVGKRSTYISFVASDTNIFISVVNKKFHELISVTVDSSFYEKVRRFRSLLSSPDFNNARNDFHDFQVTGYEIFNTLFSNVKQYLISDRIVISPDNMLSYLPFEALPVNPEIQELLSYSHITYMMEEFDISYIYSATFLAENVRHNYSSGSSLIAFAPDYSEPVNIQNLFQKRQQEGTVLEDIPFARQEAEYVSQIMGGKLFLNDLARESVFKKEASNFDIIHLAMHTVIDDNDPMYSTLIFSPDSSGTEDRYLRTYEIYGIPLKARMVVLSSCNTGSGKLFSGEGILSLARGFIYSGSESVVMAMWEIEDRAGTEIVKLYYDNLKKGYSKSKSLRKARIKFLKSADQMRSHPYFWSTLVVYGDNSALFRSPWLYTGIIIFIVTAAIAFFYVIRRRYS